MNNRDMVGRCKECDTIVRRKDEIPDYPNVYECPNCGHPHAEDELFPV